MAAVETEVAALGDRMREGFDHLAGLITGRPSRSRKPGG
jgi:hypothetical protein